MSVMMFLRCVSGDCVKRMSGHLHEHAFGKRPQKQSQEECQSGATVTPGEAERTGHDQGKPFAENQRLERAEAPGTRLAFRNSRHAKETAPESIETTGAG